MSKSKYAKELMKKVIDKGMPTKTPARHSFEAVLDMLEPIIEALAELHFATEWTRVPGYTRLDATPVPGVGAVLSCEVFDGVVYATRSDGSSAVEWRSTPAGWEKVSNSRISVPCKVGDQENGIPSSK